jgi:hypothetical protein
MIRLVKTVVISFFMVILLLIAVFPAAALAAWSTSSTENNLIVNASGNQWSPQSVSDGAGGAIIIWVDFRSGLSDGYLYAQRVDDSGNTLWTDNGTLLCNAGGEIEGLAIISDEYGGAICTWQNDLFASDNDIYAQRIDSSGTVQWTANGITICNEANRQEDAQLVSDNYGGAIIAWTDYRSGSNNDIYAQRVDEDGTAVWTDNGIPICTVTGDQYSLPIVSDGGHGAIIVWADERSDDGDIYAQRVNPSGVTQWTANGVPVCTATGSQFYAASFADGSGGAVLAWSDYRSGNVDIYAQHVDNSGTVQWTGNGIPVCTADNDQYVSSIVADGAGGTILAWTDGRSGNDDVYAQRIDGSGDALWTENGIPVCTEAYDQELDCLISDGSGGTILAWEDYRSGTGEYSDIYAQKVNSSGAPLWENDGTAVCTAANDQRSIVIVSDGADGAIIAWSDERSGSADIYAQWLTDEQGPVLPVPELPALILLGGGMIILAGYVWFRQRHRRVPVHAE